MKRLPLLFSIVVMLSLAPPLSLSQDKSQLDTLYERLKKKDINKMTEREYEYYILMKRQEVQPEVPVKEQQGQISGVVTYFFNHNYGDKPDIGSEVFILPAKYQDRWYDVMRFESEVMARTIAEGARKLGLDYSEKLMSAVEFDRLEASVSTFVEQLRYDKIPDTQKVIADGSGVFSAILKPGQYYLIARSAHRESYSNKVELSGQIDVTSDTVKSNQTTTVKFNFQER